MGLRGENLRIHLGQADPKRQGLHTRMGFWSRSNTEVCLLATRGSPQPVGRDVHQVVMAPWLSIRASLTRCSAERLRFIRGHAWSFSPAASGRGGIAGVRSFAVELSPPRRAYRKPPENRSTGALIRQRFFSPENSYG
jgi:N6-adenosine-specific RNA methylase IME4